MPCSVQTSSMKPGIGPESFGGAEAADSGGLARHERNISGSVELFRTAGSSIATCQWIDRVSLKPGGALRESPPGLGVCAEEFLRYRPTTLGGVPQSRSARTLLDCASSRSSVAE
jgi:hypothetical protein